MSSEDPGAHSTAPSPAVEKWLAVLCYLTFFFGCVVVSAAVYLSYSRHSAHLRFHAGNAANMQFSFLVLWLFFFVNVFVRIALGGAVTPWAIGMLAVFVAFLPLAVLGAVLAVRGRRLEWPLRIPFSRSRLQP